ncbi:NusA N-terminal domain-containing protein [Octadecabacter ascidiaceicola]|uniref:Transcription factor NusA N-terminal domain-containing protein n=1 Tax=Octadecabacter ascidiaceicola TaxID=1655543 RepID=A0A238K3E7_9RHOB|nr:NusA N-terminal domain-containing protein [Octadecabacter ascidiaceicola]SMX36914.1 hypothetical protein OCA8868_01166 [Octadecabacter ascidiaceicola]
MIAPTNLEWSCSGNSAVITDAYVEAAKQKHGSEFTFWARVDDSGCIEVAQVLKIVETVADERREVNLANVRQRDSKAKLGGYIVNIIDPVVPDDGKSLPIIKNLRISLN